MERVEKPEGVQFKEGRYDLVVYRYPATMRLICREDEMHYDTWVKLPLNWESI